MITVDILTGDLLCTALAPTRSLGKVITASIFFLSTSTNFVPLLVAPVPGLLGAFGLAPLPLSFLGLCCPVNEPGSNDDKD